MRSRLEGSKEGGEIEEGRKTERQIGGTLTN